MRRSVAIQFKKALRLSDGIYIDWNKFKFTPIGPVVPPDPQKGKPQLLGCTCDSCATCDQGWHYKCRKCRCGQPVS